MNIEEIINIDCSDSDNIDILVNELIKIKPLYKVYKKEGYVDLDSIEKVIRILDKKYSFGIRSLVPDCGSNNNHIVWRSTILNYKTIDVMKHIFGITIYEVLAKTALYMYYKSRNSEV